MTPLNRGNVVRQTLGGALLVACTLLIAPAASGAGCGGITNFELQPASSAQGGSGGFVSWPYCTAPWAVTTDATWLLITSPVSLSGSGALTLEATFPPNAGSSRTEHVTVTFMAPGTGSETFTFQQWGPDVTLVTTGNIGGTVGAPYSLQYSMVDGFPPISFSTTGACSSGTLPSGVTATGFPPGLSMSATGLLSGTPTTAGTYTWCVNSYDVVGYVYASWTAIIQPAGGQNPLQTQGPNALSLSVNSPITIPYPVSGGTPPYTITLSAGSLPPGLGFSGLAIAGTPTQVGSYSFTLKFSDSVGHSTTLPVTLTVLPSGPGSGGLTVSGPTSPVWTQGAASTLTYRVSGGTPPYLMSVAGGNLPPGVYLSGLTVTGTPAQAGVYPVLLKFSDNGSNTATLAVTIQIGPVLTIVPTTLNFAALPGGAALAPESIAVTTNGASVPFTLNVFTDDGLDWLLASAANKNANTPGSVTVTVQPAILGVGTYYGHVMIIAPGAIGSPLETLVTLIVSAAPTVFAYPSAINVISLPGQPAVVNAAVSVFTTNASSIQASVFEGADWLTVKQNGTTSPVIVSIQGQQTTPGTGLGVVRIDTPGNTPSSIDIPVTAVALPPPPGPDLVIAPPTFSRPLYSAYDYPDVSPNAFDEFYIPIWNYGDTPVTVTVSGGVVCGEYFVQTQDYHITFVCPGVSTLTPTGGSPFWFLGIVPAFGPPAVYDFSECASAPGFTTTCRTIPITVISSGAPLPDQQYIYFSSAAAGVGASIPGAATASPASKIVRRQTTLATPVSAGQASEGSAAVVVTNPTATPVPYATDTTGTAWLSVSPSSGQMPANSSFTLTLSFDPTGLAVGTYFGSFNLTSSGATTVIPVEFRVQATAPPFSAVGSLTFSGGVLTALLPQNLTRGATSSYTYTCLLSDGSVCTLTSGTQTIVTLPAPTGSGPRSGTLTINWGTVGSAVVNLLALPAAASPCKATLVAVAPDSLTPFFQAPALRPARISARAVDDCSQPLTSGSVSASIGGQTINLTSSGGGIWSGTWIPGSAQQGGVVVTFAASSSTGLTGQVLVNGTVTAADATSAPRAGQIANDAIGVASSFAPGTRFSVTGEGFSGMSTTLLVGGTEVPILASSDTSIEAVLPPGYPATGEEQVVVQRDGVLSAPIPVVVSSTAPEIYLLGDGTQQGRIYLAGTGMLAAVAGTGSQPATSGSAIVIPCTGLGQLANQSNADGTQAPAILPTLSIGGVPATVTSAFVLPEWPGLYWVEAVVPSVVPTGNQITVTVSSAGSTSQPATIAIQ